jgi:hypothetical protein
MMHLDELAERLYKAYWIPSAVLTGREIAPWHGQHDAEKAAWRSVAHSAYAALAPGHAFETTPSKPEGTE